MSKLSIIKFAIRLLLFYLALITFGLSFVLSSDSLKYIPFSFIFKINDYILYLLCFLFALPYIIQEVKEYRQFCFKNISWYWDNIMIINRLKKNGHGNPYTEEESNEINTLKEKIEREERKVKILNIFLLQFKN